MPQQILFSVCVCLFFLIKTLFDETVYRYCLFKTASAFEERQLKKSLCSFMWDFVPKRIGSQRRAFIFPQDLAPNYHSKFFSHYILLSRPISLLITSRTALLCPHFFVGTQHEMLSPQIGPKLQPKAKPSRNLTWPPRSHLIFSSPICSMCIICPTSVQTLESIFYLVLTPQSPPLDRRNIEGNVYGLFISVFPECLHCVFSVYTK